MKNLPLFLPLAILISPASFLVGTEAQNENIKVGFYFNLLFNAANSRPFLAGPGYNKLKRGGVDVFIKKGDLVGERKKELAELTVGDVLPTVEKYFSNVVSPWGFYKVDVLLAQLNSGASAGEKDVLGLQESSGKQGDVCCEARARKITLTRRGHAAIAAGTALLAVSILAVSVGVYRIFHRKKAARATPADQTDNRHRSASFTDAASW